MSGRSTRWRCSVTSLRRTRRTWEVRRERSLCARVVHGGRALGPADWYDQRGSAQGTRAPDAGDLHQGDPRRPHGLAEHLRVSRLQDEAARPDLRVDLQPQVQGEAGPLGAGRRGTLLQV